MQSPLRATEPVKNNLTTLPTQPSPAVVFLTAGRSAAQRIIATRLLSPCTPGIAFDFLLPHPIYLPTADEPCFACVRVSHLPRRADAETPPLRVSQSMNHNSPHAAFLSRASAVLALLYERLRGICAISILHPCVVASLVSQCLCMVSHVSGVIIKPITQYPESPPHMHALVSRAPVTGKHASIS